MKRTFDISIVEGHLLISDNGNVILVDTGSPKTIHCGPVLSFLGKEYRVSSHFMGGIESLKNLAQVEFTTLMGMDILSQYRVVFDYENKQITFLTEDEQGLEGTELSMFSFLDGHIGVMMQIGGKLVKMVLDTGAPTSYMSKRVTAAYEKSGEKADFSPMVGRFITPVYDIETEVAGKTFMCSYGHLPFPLSVIFNDVDGVVGYDFLKSFKVMMDCKGGLVVVR